jgi:hypothetical protein
VWYIVDASGHARVTRVEHTWMSGTERRAKYRAFGLAAVAMASITITHSSEKPISYMSFRFGGWSRNQCAVVSNRYTPEQRDQDLHKHTQRAYIRTHARTHVSAHTYAHTHTHTHTPFIVVFRQVRRATAHSVGRRLFTHLRGIHLGRAALATVQEDHLGLALIVGVVPLTDAVVSE